MRRRIQRPTSSAPFVVLMLALIVVATLGLGELLVRILFRYNTPDTVRKNSLQYREIVYARSALARDQRPDLSKAWGLRRGEQPTRAAFVINEHGYRGASFAIKKPAGIRRVVVLGGSAVFDVSAPLGRDWPHLVEERLHAAGHLGIEVINGGIPGYSSADSVGRLFTEIWMLQPDYVLLYNAWNDIKYFNRLSEGTSIGEIVRPFRAGANPLQYYRNPLDRFLAASQLYVKLRTRYYLWKVDIGAEGVLPRGQQLAGGPYPLGLAQYRLNLSLFAKASDAIGAIPVLATQATLATVDLPEEDRRRITYGYVGLQHSDLVEAFASCREVMLDVAREQGVELIDAARILSGRSELFKDHVHTTTLGSERLAELVADHLADLLTETADPPPGVHELPTREEGGARER